MIVSTPLAGFTLKDAEGLPDEVIELVDLLLIVVRKSILLSFLTLDEDGFNL